MRAACALCCRKMRVENATHLFERIKRKPNIHITTRISHTQHIVLCQLLSEYTEYVYVVASSVITENIVRNKIPTDEKNKIVFSFYFRIDIESFKTSLVTTMLNSNVTLYTFYCMPHKTLSIRVSVYAACRTHSEHINCRRGDREMYAAQG